MALIEEIEPPSPSSDRKNDFLKKGFGLIQTLYKRGIWGVDKLLKDQKALKIGFDWSGLTRRFLGSLFQTKYLPHIALLTLVMIISAVNVRDKIEAKAAYDQIVATDPEVSVALASELDKYTTLIDQDSFAVDRSIQAEASAVGFLVNTSPVETTITEREEPLPDNSIDTVYYVVKDGDTLTGLGWKFDVKLATLKYLNDIQNENMLKPGTKLKVPPKNFEVSEAQIAKKAAEKEAKLAAARRTTYTRSQPATRTSNVNYKPGSQSNSYPYGYCTYYVATRRYVPNNWGHAKYWLGSAQRAGYSTGSTPAVGSIAVTTESWWGHVAFVESVDGNNITLAEMNYRGWGVTSRRTISANAGMIRGYIY